ncbi:hypothetical protein Tco_1137240 [Tanacetum coccineum]
MIILTPPWKYGKGYIGMESSETREYPSLIQTLFGTHTYSGEFAQDEARVQCEEMIRLRDLGATPMGVPYTEDPIMAMVQEKKQWDHILGVGRVLAGHGRDAISINEPRGAYTDADVDEIKEDNKWLRKELIMLVRVAGVAARGGGDDEPGADDEHGGDEDADGDDEIYDMLYMGQVPVGRWRQGGHVTGDSWPKLTWSIVLKRFPSNMSPGII